jgi:hypothetical protein
VQDGLRAEVAALRDSLHFAGHKRTPGIIADLAIGLQYFFDFAVASAAITAAERETLESRCRAALLEAGAEHSKNVDVAEPCGQFLRLLAAVLASGRAHVAGPDGRQPDHAAGWGWRDGAALGRRIGWLEGSNLYLEPEAAYAEAQKLASDQGDSLPVTATTMWRRLKERGHLASWDQARQRNTVRRRLEGSDRREVIHLCTAALSTGAQPSPSSPNATQPQENLGPDGDGSGDGRAGDGQHRPQNRPHHEAEFPQEKDPGDGGDRARQGYRSPASEDVSPPSTRRRGTL